ncbi:unnamed protein product [Leptosia nina]|uniref:Uncharacterized protein n=1 Tax=Leptosia nina TaxID=320188 RepID=A0AAV1K2J6_9NEOP
MIYQYFARDLRAFRFNRRKPARAHTMINLQEPIYPTSCCSLELIHNSRVYSKGFLRAARAIARVLSARADTGTHARGALWTPYKYPPPFLLPSFPAHAPCSVCRVCSQASCKYT